MSFGSWALLVFSLFSFLSFVGAVAEDERRWPIFNRWGNPWPLLRRLRSPSLVARVMAVAGGVAGLFLAGYTGVLLSVTNRPIWADTPLLGMLFVVSAASTSAALLILLAVRRGWNVPGLVALHRLDGRVIVLELVVLIALLVSLGPVLRAWMNAWGLLLLVVVLIGMVMPLALLWRRDGFPRRARTASMLVLIGGLLLRVVIVMSSESITR
jgi:formate-dependent nitrite reductase membrane component NrfD